MFFARTSLAHIDVISGMPRLLACISVMRWLTVLCAAKKDEAVCDNLHLA